MDKDIDFDLTENSEEVKVVLVDNTNEIDVDIAADEKSIDFDIVDDNEEVNVDLVDGSNTINFKMTDYDDSEIKQEISNIQTQVNTNTTQIARNKADIQALDDRVDQIPIITKTSQLTNDSGFITSDYHDDTKQDKLVSGQNIKTINNESILGSGNIEIQGGGTDNYEELENLPSINNIELIGNKSLNDLGIQPKGDYALRSEIPDVSDFITKDVDNLTNYYTKTQVDDKVNFTIEDVTYTTVQDTVDMLINEFADALDDKQDIIDDSHKLLSDYVDDTNQTNLFVTSQEKTTWNNKSDFSGNYNDLTNKPDLSVFATTTELGNETTARENADIGLQSQIDAITSSSDVKDIVGTYQELQNYDTSTLGNDDIIKVLQDSTHNNAMTYYRWVITGSTSSWQYIGQEGPYYTKSESDTLLNAKQNEITSSNMLDSDLVNDTNQTNKFVTASEKTTWNNKADYGFYGIISGTSANPTDGASLLNGVYKVDESQNTSYINLTMEDGTTKRQSVQKGGIVIRTNARLVILATQNLMYQYDIAQHFFYPAEPFVESVLRREFVDGIADLGTVSPPNTYYMTLPISYLEATVNTGDTGHTRLTFTVEEGIEKGDFELHLTDTEGNDLIYENGIVPQPASGETWILEIYGNTCEALRFTETEIIDSYNDLADIPQYTVGKTTFDNTTREISVSTENITIEGTHDFDYYRILNFVPLDLTPYNTSTRSNMLHPETQLPDGNYYVTGAGKIWFSSESYSCIPGEIIYKHNNEMVVVGMYGCVYYAYDTTDEEWRGGFFTTYQDVTDMLDERIFWKNIASGSFVVASKDNGYYTFNYTSGSGTTRRITVNVEGTNTYYYPYNGTILIKNDKYVVILGRENKIFEYDSTNQYYKEPLDITTALSSINDKYDKTGGEISGDVKIDGNLTLDIEDPDYDSGIRFTKALDTNLGTVLTLTGYANAQGSETNYRPIIRNIGTPNSNYDVANKKYVDDNVVVPTYHLVFLNPDGTVDTYASTINYNTIKSNMTDPKEKDYLDVIWNQTRFYAEVVEVTDVNNGDIKFIADIEYAGIPRRMVFTLNPQSVLTTTSITTGEIISNKKSSVVNNLSNDYYPSTNAVYNEFQRKPVVVWESNDPTQYLKGIQANLSASPAWQLTDLDLTPYKRIKIYTCAGKGSTNASTTPAIVLEMSLDSRAVSTAWGNNYVASAVIQKSNDNNRLATLTCAVSADKTSFVVLWQTSLYGTAATSNNDVNANVFMIEGYYD